MPQALKTFRDNVRAMLKKLDWKYPDIAKRTGIPAPSLSVYLTGKKDPNVETCERIASAFGVSLTELFNSNTPPIPRIERHELADEVKTQIEAGVTLIRKDLEHFKAEIKALIAQDKSG